MMIDPVSRLVYEMSKLPGIGERTAMRLVQHLLRQETSEVQALATALIDMRTRMSPCQECFHFTETQPCQICADTRRVSGLICVVERSSDVYSLEAARAHAGSYHVLQGVLSPLDGIGPEKLRIAELIHRVQAFENGPGEIIFALNPSVEGEATAMYLSELLRPLGTKLSRLATGLPAGAVLEFTDRQTLSRAFAHRMEMK